MIKSIRGFHTYYNTAINILRLYSVSVSSTPKEKQNRCLDISFRSFVAENPILSLSIDSTTSKRPIFREFLFPTEFKWEFDNVVRNCVRFWDTCWGSGGSGDRSDRCSCRDRTVEPETPTAGESKRSARSQSVSRFLFQQTGLFLIFFYSCLFVLCIYLILPLIREKKTRKNCSLFGLMLGKLFVVITAQLFEADELRCF